MASEKFQQKSPIGDQQIWKKYIYLHTHTYFKKTLQFEKKYMKCV